MISTASKNTFLGSDRFKTYNLDMVLLSRLMTDRAPYEPKWREVQEILEPHLSNWDPSQTNFPDTVNDLLVSSHPLQSFDDMMAGLSEGVTSQHEPWFSAGTPYQEIKRSQSSMNHLHNLTELMQSVIAGMNFYQEAPVFFRSGSRFCTAAMLVEKDWKKVSRCTVFPIGSYYLSNNDEGMADTFARRFRWRVRQVVEKYCTDPEGNVNLAEASDYVKRCWEDPKLRENFVDLAHLIYPNPDYNPARAMYDTRFAKYASHVFEYNRNNYGKFLEMKGFHTFRVLAFRWFRQYTDAYGIDGPGYKAIGPINELYKKIELKLNGLEKVVDPPMTYDQAMRGQAMGTVPGFPTAVPSQQGSPGFKPAYQITPDLNAIKEDIETTKKEIDKITFVDIFRQIANDERKQPPTATEVMQQLKENMAVLGPVFGNFKREFIIPFLEIIYEDIMEAVMEGRLYLPPPPPELMGMPVKWEISSAVEIALKQGRIAPKDAFRKMLMEYKEIDPNVADHVDTREYVTQYTDDLNLRANLVRDEKEVAATQQARAEQAQREHAMQAVPALAGAAKNLSQTEMGGNSALAHLTGTQDEEGAEGE